MPLSCRKKPLPEAKAGWDILRALDLRHRGVQLIACPTCGRTCIDVAGIAARVEEELADILQGPRLLFVPRDLSLVQLVVIEGVIRREDDKGVIVLIDDRYETERYKALLPDHWNHLEYARNPNELAEILTCFWN